MRQVQDQYKMWAVLLPPIPPLLVAVVVFFTRRTPRTRGRGPIEIAITIKESVRQARLQDEGLAVACVQTASTDN